METKLYKFSGAGNDFVVIDGREGDVSSFREVARIEALCREFRTDGLMIHVEISKYYSTPKSRSFVNGLLDNLIKNKLSLSL